MARPRSTSLQGSTRPKENNAQGMKENSAFYIFYTNFLLFLTFRFRENLVQMYMKIAKKNEETESVFNTIVYMGSCHGSN